MNLPLMLKKIFRPIYVPIFSWFYNTFRAPRRYHHLYNTIREMNAATILEIGVWNGKRAVKMIKEAQKHNSNIFYFGYDLFEDLGKIGYHAEFSKMPPTKEEVHASLSATGATVRLFKGNTLETLPNSISELPQIDFIFIDGGHSIETIQSDWNNIQKIMNKQTIVIFDDYWRNRTDAGCKLIVDAIDTTRFFVEVLPEIDVFDNPDFGRLEISFAKVVKKQI